MSRDDFRRLDGMTEQIHQVISQSLVAFPFRPPLARLGKIVFSRRTGAMTGPARQLIDGSVDGLSLELLRFMTFDGLEISLDAVG